MGTLLDPIGTIALAIAIAGLAAALLSRLLTLWIERRSPPCGRFADVDSVRLHLRDLQPAVTGPEAPAVLLVHGANLCLADMDLALGKRLSRRLRVIIPDRPGQGHSAAGPGRVSSPEYQAKLLRELVAQCGAARTVVVGHSYGGLIALRYAIDNPATVAGLVLVNPTTHPRPSGLPWFQRLAGAVLGPILVHTLLLPLSLAMASGIVRRMFRPEAPPPDYAARGGLEIGLTPRRFLASLAEYADLRDNLLRHVPLYPQLAVPAVILAGNLDATVPPDIHAAALAKAMPQARLLSLPGAGHMAHHGHADVVAQAVERLAGLAPEPQADTP